MYIRMLRLCFTPGGRILKSCQKHSGGSGCFHWRRLEWARKTKWGFNLSVMVLKKKKSSSYQSDALWAGLEPVSVMVHCPKWSHHEHHFWHLSLHFGPLDLKAKQLFQELNPQPLDSQSIYQPPELFNLMHSCPQLSVLCLSWTFKRQVGKEDSTVSSPASLWKILMWK